MTLFEKLRCLFTFGQGVVLPLPSISEDSNPFDLFEQWLADATNSGILLPESMSISTCSSDGQPSSRMVLLKEFDSKGFVFFTNYESKKSHELLANPKVSLLFHWNVLQRQVRIEGNVEKISFEESEEYFHSRSRGSQIGAWASIQSKRYEHDKELIEREKYFKEKFKSGVVPLPEFWGGYRVIPKNIEFWQGRANRLHDRVCFEKVSGSDTEKQWGLYKLHP